MGGLVKFEWIEIEQMKITQQASWMVRKIIGARTLIIHMQSRTPNNRSMIKHVYLQLIGALPRVDWRYLMFNNTARPRAIFTLWLPVQV